MADVADHQRGAGERSSLLPSKYFPAVEHRDLPEPSGLRKYMGASVILLATALGSGELIIWPSITAQVGIGLVWLAVLGISMQIFLNMEIERYTLATGETAVTGFSRLWKPWGIIFVLGAILPNAWPGWASSGATEFTFIFGLSRDSVPLIATIFLLAIGISITVSPVIYQLLEKVQAVMVIIILCFIVLAIIIATDLSTWAGVVTKAPAGVANLPNYLKDLGAASLLGAIAFAGAGGANNLVQSNYVRDKGMGMGILIPNIVSPITGEEEAAPSLGYAFPETEENARRWRGWWKVANQEQLITFWFIGGLLLVALSVLVFSTIGIQNEIPGDLSFVKKEGDALGNSIAPWFEEFFFIAGFVMLFSTNIGVLDYVARLTGDSLKVNYLGESEFWSESKIYITVVWAMIIAGIVILWAGLTQPLILLIIAAAGGGVVMALYSVMLIVLNRRTLPEVAKLKGWRVPVMVFIAIFFVFFSLLLVYDQISGLFGG
jgi:Mn2+/Fe2+ NRAMP family transporter